MSTFIEGLHNDDMHPYLERIAQALEDNVEIGEKTLAHLQKFTASKSDGLLSNAEIEQDVFDVIRKVFPTSNDQQVIWVLNGIRDRGIVFKKEYDHG